MRNVYRGLTTYEKLVKYMRGRERELKKAAKRGNMHAIRLVSRYTILSWLLVKGAPDDLVIWQHHDTLQALRTYEAELGIEEKENSDVPL